jgi:hypothetical protein
MMQAVRQRQDRRAASTKPEKTHQMTAQREKIITWKALLPLESFCQLEKIIAVTKKSSEESSARVQVHMDLCV